MKMFFSISASLMCLSVSAQQRLPPPVPNVDSMAVQDTLYNLKIDDPFRGLEKLDHKEVNEWIQQQQQYTQHVLSDVGVYDSMLNQLEASEPTSDTTNSLPIGAQNFLFYISTVKSSGKQVLMMQEGSSNAIEVFSTEYFDDQQPERYTINFFNPSPKGQHVVLGISSEGKEVATLYTLDVQNRSLLEDSIPRTLLGLPQWTSDGSGFYYHQFKETDNPREHYYDSKTKFHQINTSTGQDKVVLSSEQIPSLGNLDFPFIFTFPETDYVLGVVYHGVEPNASLYLTKESALIKSDSTHWESLVSADQKVEQFAISGETLYLLKYDRNANGEFAKMSLEPSNNRKLETITQSQNDTLFTDFLLSRDGIYLLSNHNVISTVHHYDPISLRKTRVPTPFNGSIKLGNSMNNAPFNGYKGLYFKLESWTTPPAIYRYNSDSQSTALSSMTSSPDTNLMKDVISEEVLVTGHDGVEIPLSIIHHKDIAFNGENPTILAVYGSYGNSIDPFYNSKLNPWFQSGGVYAFAHVRGGGEKGRDWYEAGLLSTKQNSWLDYLSCAHWLIDQQYTSSKKLAAWSGSAGCITVGRAITVEPSLFRAGILQVGLLNPFRHEQTPNNTNISEFGSVTDSSQIRTLYDMDPYMHVESDTEYPALIFTAGKNDPRVPIWQPAKMVARLQSASPRPVLLRINNSGHFGGKGDDKLMEWADFYTFLFWQLGEIKSKTDHINE